MKPRSIVLATGLAIVFATLPVLAHHAFNADLTDRSPSRSQER